MADQHRLASSAADEDRESDSWKAVRALYKQAKTKTAEFRQNFERDWKFLLGENHNPVPKNTQAAQRIKGRNQGVRNWLYATCDQKAQMILGPKPKYTAIPYGAPVDFTQRWKVQEAIEDLHRRVRAEEFDEDCVWDGMATGKGYTQILVKKDPRSGMPSFALEALDPSRVYWNPDEGSRIADLDILHVEKWLTAAKCREIFNQVDPQTGVPAWMKIKFRSVPITSPDNRKDYRSRTDQEILAGGGYTFQYNAKGQLCELGADICFTWVRNEEIENEITERLVSGERDGYSCASCGDIFDAPHLEPPDTEVGMEESIPATPQCPTCGSEALAPVRIPATVDRTLTGKKFKYPYGILKVHCEDGMLWEGSNPDKIDCVFPVFEYHHRRVNRRFAGYGEVGMLRTAQVNANKNMQQLMDYLRTSVNGLLEYPNRVPTYAALSNQPNAKIGLPIPLIGLARYLPAAPFNIQAFVTAEETIRRDFQEMGGITDVVYGLAPTSPTSGKEVVARRDAATTRVDGHTRRLAQYRSARGTALHQLAWQHLTLPSYFPVRNSAGDPDMVLMAYRTLPRNMKIAVSADLEDAQRSELTTQAIQTLMQQGILPPALDLLLPTMGLKTWEAQTLMDRANLMKQEQGNQPQQNQQPSDPASLITALAALIKSGGVLARNQLEAALENAALPPPDLSTGIVMAPQKPEPKKTISPSPN